LLIPLLAFRPVEFQACADINDVFSFFAPHFDVFDGSAISFLAQKF
jgi:hypothetical protein